MGSRNTTVLSALDEMILDYRAIGRTESTIHAYGSMVRAFGTHCNKTLADITREDIREYYIAMRQRNAYVDAENKPEQKHGLSPHTIVTHDRHLRGFFSWAVDAGYLDKSPMDGLRKPSAPKQLPKAISPNQFLSLMTAARVADDPQQSARNVALLSILGDTGCRVSELLSLSFDNFDLESKRGWVYSKGSEREVFITTFTQSLVRRWLHMRDHDSRYFFTSVTSGEPLTGSGVHQMLQRIRKKSGVKGKVSAHRFRHGFAVEFVKAGGDVSTLAALLGHDSIKTTDDYYTVFSGDELKQIHDEVNPLARMLQG